MQESPKKQPPARKRNMWDCPGARKSYVASALFIMGSRTNPNSHKRSQARDADSHWLNALRKQSILHLGTRVNHLFLPLYYTLHLVVCTIITIGSLFASPSTPDGGFLPSLWIAVESSTMKHWARTVMDLFKAADQSTTRELTGSSVGPIKREPFKDWLTEDAWLIRAMLMNLLFTIPYA